MSHDALERLFDRYLETLLVHDREPEVGELTDDAQLAQALERRIELYRSVDRTLSRRRTLRPGERLGTFQVVRWLGAGGAGQVYAVEDRQGALWALKLLSPDVATPSSLPRLRRELSASQRIDHPAVVKVHALLEEGSDCFLVMDLVDGEPLSERLRRGPLDNAAEVSRLGLELCSALAAVHEANVVHRDVKPANLMLTPSGARLLDFGLAKLHSQTASFVDTLTDTRAAVGTLPYAAPEQLLGEAVDPRTDLWSTGAVLYHCLSGHPPFGERSFATTLAAILESEPAPMKRADLPQPLEQLILECLAKRAEDRPQDALELVERLTPLAQGP